MAARSGPGETIDSAARACRAVPCVTVHIISIAFLDVVALNAPCAVSFLNNIEWCEKLRSGEKGTIKPGTRITSNPYGNMDSQAKRRDSVTIATVRTLVCPVMTYRVGSTDKW